MNNRSGLKKTIPSKDHAHVADSPNSLAIVFHDPGMLCAWTHGLIFRSEEAYIDDEVRPPY